jgi:hypothetical protein
VVLRLHLEPKIWTEFALQACAASGRTETFSTCEQIENNNRLIQQTTQHALQSMEMWHSWVLRKAGGSQRSGFGPKPLLIVPSCQPLPLFQAPSPSSPIHSLFLLPHLRSSIRLDIHNSISSPHPLQPRHDSLLFFLLHPSCIS